MLLKFIGTGSAFNTKLGCNSAYIIKNNSLILFDCGGDVFSKLKELNIIKDEFKNIYIFITHLHPDHIGSLGDLIYYNYFILKKDNKERNFGVENLVIWLIGFIIYRAFMRIDIPIGNTLPAMLITVLICVIVSFVRGNKFTKN